MKNIAVGEFLCLIVGVCLRRSNFDNLNFLKLRTTLSKYWTSIKIKISMTWVYKEYKIKIQMVQEQWLQLKMKFWLGYNMKIVI